jgi:hypothetical protein
VKKLLLLVGAAVGFVLGSKMGREPYERLEAQVRQLAGRPEVKGAVEAVSDEAADLTDAMAGVKKTGAGGPTGSIDQAEIDAETEAALDLDLEDSFPTSDPSSSWAGPDIGPERPKQPAETIRLKQPTANAD